MSDFESKLDDIGKRRAEELGLKTDMGVWYPANDIHQLLSEGIEVFGNQFKMDGGTGDLGWCCDEEKRSADTHHALLIGIKPIVQESEERKLLRELIDAHESEGRYGVKFNEAEKKAKRLLERKGE